MAKPRMMKVSRTRYFDIIWSAESETTASLLYENADRLYENAKTLFCAEHDFRTVVVISPDSDSFSAVYSASPYNRIIIYDAVPDQESFQYRHILLDSFYHEVLSAVSQSMRDRFWTVVSSILVSDALQPATILNLPFSFIQGISSLEEENRNALNDNYNLQLLMQAKSEGRFPSWIDCAGSRDIWPGDELASAANIAFAAYLQSRFGVTKYIDFWHESGRVYFVFFTAGIFYKVYGLPLSEVWNDFIESIPLPEESEADRLLASRTSRIFNNDIHSLYTDLVSTPYGLVWYDSMNHEVSIYNPEGTSKNRELLFLADEVTKLSSDSSGRFLAVSRMENKNRSNHRENVTGIYDLQKRSFLSGEFSLRDSCIITMKDGLYAVAGINTQTKIPRVEVRLSPEMNRIVYQETGNSRFEVKSDTLVCSRDFALDEIPFSLTRIFDGQLFFLLNRNGTAVMGLTDISEKRWVFYDINTEVPGLGIKAGHGISDVRQLKNGFQLVNRETVELSFQYVPYDSYSFMKTGLITLGKNLEVHDILLQNQNLNGGVWCPSVFGNRLFFYSRNFDHNNLMESDVTALTYSKASWSLSETEAAVPLAYFASLENQKAYNPFPYLFRGTWIPMMPVKKISIENGPEIWPGIGLTYKTQSDPLNNTSLTLSVARDYAKLDFTNVFNETEESRRRQSEEQDFTHDGAIAAFIRNTTTPVDLMAGEFFSFTTDGSYTLQLLAGTQWQIPLGMTFRKLTINISSSWNFSTEYSSLATSIIHPELPAWTPLSDAYRYMELSASALYSNMHQSGISPYERRGVELNYKLYASWDSAQIERRDAASSFVSPTIVSFSVSGTAAVPRLNPLRDNNGFILGLPAQIKMDLLKDTGTAFELDSRFLLIGNELQRGIPVLNLYLTRVGFFGGYDLVFDYSVKRDLLPDLRSYSKFIEVFQNMVLNDKIYFQLDFVFSPVIGRISKIGMDNSLKFSYGIRTKEFRLTYLMKFNM